MDPLQGELRHFDVTRSLFDADTIAPQSTKHLRKKEINSKQQKQKQRQQQQQQQQKGHTQT